MYLLNKMKNMTIFNSLSYINNNQNWKKSRICFIYSPNDIIAWLKIKSIKTETWYKTTEPMWHLFILMCQASV